MLDALAALELPATFFVIGQQVPERAAVLRRMVQAGHAVGVHAWEHPDLGAEPERAPDEIDRCLAAVREAAGMAPDLFRPPFGSYTPAVLEQADARGLRTILWDVNPHDHAGGDATADSITADVSRACAGARSSCSTTAARWTRGRACSTRCRASPTGCGSGGWRPLPCRT